MWIPRTRKDIELAIGTLSESEALDFKRDLAPGQKLNDIRLAGTSLAKPVLGVFEQHR